MSKKQRYFARFNQRDNEGRLIGLINDDPVQIGYPSPDWSPPRPKFGEIWPVRLIGNNAPYNLMPVGKPVTGKGPRKMMPHWKESKANKKTRKEDKV